MVFRTCLVTQVGDFPGGPAVKNLPYNVGDTGSIPRQRPKIPHAVGQLNPCATTTEPVSLEPVPRNEGSQQREAQTM